MKRAFSFVRAAAANFRMSQCICGCKRGLLTQFTLLKIAICSFFMAYNDEIDTFLCHNTERVIVPN